MIDFKVPRTKDCVIIDTKNWLQNSSQILTIHRMSGRDIPTFLAKAVEVNNSNECFDGAIEKGDTLFLTRVVSEVAQCRPFEVEVGGCVWNATPRSLSPLERNIGFWTQA